MCARENNMRFRDRGSQDEKEKVYLYTQTIYAAVGSCNF